MKRLIRIVTVFGLIVSTGASLSACGKKGDVKPPPSYQHNND